MQTYQSITKVIFGCNKIINVAHMRQAGTSLWKSFISEIGGKLLTTRTTNPQKSINMLHLENWGKVTKIIFVRQEIQKYISIICCKFKKSGKWPLWEQNTANNSIKALNNAWQINVIPASKSFKGITFSSFWNTDNIIARLA